MLRATVATMDSLTLTGNTVAGPLSPTGGGTYDWAVRLAASPHQIEGVTMALNSSRGALMVVQSPLDGGVRTAGG
jgi:hypothetical protein